MFKIVVCSANQLERRTDRINTGHSIGLTYVRQVKFKILNGKYESEQPNINHPNGYFTMYLHTSHNNISRKVKHRRREVAAISNVFTGCSNNTQMHPNCTDDTPSRKCQLDTWYFISLIMPTPGNAYQQFPLSNISLSYFWELSETGWVLIQSVTCIQHALSGRKVPRSCSSIFGTILLFSLCVVPDDDQNLI